jgi:hypothetical protein
MELASLYRELAIAELKVLIVVRRVSACWISAVSVFTFRVNVKRLKQSPHLFSEIRLHDHLPIVNYLIIKSTT